MTCFRLVQVRFRFGLAVFVFAVEEEVEVVLTGMITELARLATAGADPC